MQASRMHLFLSQNSHPRPGKLRLGLLSDFPGPKLTDQSLASLCGGKSCCCSPWGIQGEGPPPHPEAQGRKARAAGRGQARVSGGLQEWTQKQRGRREIRVRGLDSDLAPHAYVPPLPLTPLHRAATRVRQVKHHHRGHRFKETLPLNVVQKQGQHPRGRASLPHPGLVPALIALREPCPGQREPQSLPITC